MPATVPLPETTPAETETCAASPPTTMLFLALIHAAGRLVQLRRPGGKASRCRARPGWLEIRFQDSRCLLLSRPHMHTLIQQENARTNRRPNPKQAEATRQHGVLHPSRPAPHAPRDPAPPSCMHSRLLSVIPHTTISPVAEDCKSKCIRSLHGVFLPVITDQCGVSWMMVHHLVRHPTKLPTRPANNVHPPLAHMPPAMPCARAQMRTLPERHHGLLVSPLALRKECSAKDILGRAHGRRTGDNRLVGRASVGRLW